LLVGAGVLLLASCGGSAKPKAESRCPTGGAHATFPLLDRKRPHNVDVLTNLGGFVFRLDVADSPCTTSSFAALVRRHFFDGTIFHRIVPGFIIQGGDPTGTGRGGPGYTTVDAPPKNALYTEGVVAMAKTQAEPPGTAGSQFFIVTKGLKVVERIGRLGNRVTERPTRRVAVLRMTLASS
jgi:cyclophilin family peptidyl-prolyl cis-trans isomerase